MIDNRPPKPRKVSDKPGISNISTDSSWQVISTQIFAKCLAWQNGNLYSLSSLQQSALDLAEAITNLSYFSLSHFETPTIREFIEDYKMHLAVIEAGPGIGKKPKLRKKAPHYAEFVEIANDAIEHLEREINLLEAESYLAYKRHEDMQDTDIENIGFRYKHSIDLSGPLSLSMARLEAFAAGRPIRSKSNSPISLRPRINDEMMPGPTGEGYLAGENLGPFVRG